MRAIYTTLALLAAMPLCAWAEMDSTASHAGTLTLKQTLQQTYHHNFVLKSERAQASATERGILRSYASWLPSVDAYYHMGRTRTNLNDTGHEYENPDSYGLTLSQPLFKGGRSLAEWKQARLNSDAARWNFKEQEQAVMLSAIGVFLDIILNREIYQLSQHKKSVLAAHLDAALDRFEVGDATRTDVAQAESRLSLAESDALKAKADTIRSSARFERVVGIKPPPGTRNLPSPYPNNMPNLPETYDMFKTDVMAQNFRLKAAEKRYLSAEQDTNASYGAFLPEINLEGSMDRRRDQSGFAREIDSDEVMVTFSFPLFRGGENLANTQEARDLEKKTGFERDETRLQIHDDAITFWNDVHTARAQIKAAQAGVRAATLALDGVKQEQQLGARTVIDVLDAEEELFEAQVALSTAKHDTALAVYQAQMLMGKLTAVDLGLE